MDWTKAKTKHFLHSEFSLAERGALITIFCLTAHLEKMPSEKMMIAHTSKHSLASLRDKLDMDSMTLREVLDKVLEDVVIVNNVKKTSATTSQTYRDKRKSDESRDNGGDVIEKKREEENKKREEEGEDVNTPNIFKFMSPNCNSKSSVLNYLDALCTTGKINKTQRDVISDEIGFKVSKDDFNKDKLEALKQCDSIIKKITEQPEPKKQDSYYDPLNGDEE